MQSRNKVIVRDVETEYSVDAIPRGAVAENLRDLHEFATLSANIYEAEDKRVSLPHWHLFESPPYPARRRWHFEISGLGCEAWIRQRPDEEPLAVIVFRGTDAKQIGDWFSNLRWVTRFVPLVSDQYEQTQKLVGPLVDGIRAEYGDNIVIAATGHSLGGGLAQQAAYCSPHIGLVYAFDASMVTGYYDVPRNQREVNRAGLRIYRVYEHGEVLAYLRLLFKAIYPVSGMDPKIIEIRYNLTSGNPIRQHGIADLARSLTKIAADQAANQQTP